MERRVQFHYLAKYSWQKITPAQAAALITKGKTGKISGFKKRDGGTFSAALSLEDGKVQFLFINKK